MRGSKLGAHGPGGRPGGPLKRPIKTLAKNFTSAYIGGLAATAVEVFRMAGKGQQGRGSPDGSRPGVEAMGAGVQFALSIVVFLLAGDWLDERLGTTPWFLILGVMVGAGGGFFSMYRRLIVRPRDRSNKGRDE